MRRLNMLMFLFMIAVSVQAQFINNGATVTIQSGATLRVETDIQNNGTGTITNNGTIEVMGNFTNAATANLTPSIGLVRFIGTTSTTLNTGGKTLNNVEMAKTTATGEVTLAAAASIGGNLSFTGATNNKIKVANFDLTMPNSGSTVSATTNHATNGYVVTDKTGVNTGGFVKGIASGASTRTLEVGDDVNYSPVTLTVNASSAGTIRSRVITNAAPNPLTAKYAETTDYINREWVVTTTNVTTNSLTGTYVAGDVVGTQSLIKGATYHTGDWRFDGSAGSGSTVTATTTNSSVRFSGKNFFGKANLKAYLAGALPSGVTMTTDLNTAGIIPLVTPYNVAPFSAPTVTAPSIPATAVDWVLVEVRNAATPSTLISQTSGFLLSNGTIVNYDGTALKLKNAVANGHIALKHRNHLSIRTATSLDLVNPPVLKDFSLNTSEAYTDVSITTNANMRQIGSVFCLWNGDASQNNEVAYTGGGNDSSPILTRVGGAANATNIVNGYYKEDVDLDGAVLYSGGGNDRSRILTVVGGAANATNIIFSHF